MKKRILGIWLLLVVVISSFSFPSHAMNTNMDLSKEEQKSWSIYGKEFMKKQEESAVAYQELKTKVFNSVIGHKLYGGAYINDYGRLVINVKGNSLLGTYADGMDLKTSFMRECKRICSDVEFRKCKFSYDELTEEMDRINAYKVSSNEKFADEFDYYKLDDRLNCIVVELNNFTEENIEFFKKKVSDCEAIIFTKSKNDDVLDSGILPGASISCLGHTGSVGYRVKRNGVNGFVTSAHFVKSGASVTSGGRVIGYCDVSVNSGTVDAAFVRVTEGTPGNTINGMGTTLSTIINEPGVGTMINKCGEYTGATSGRITSTNVTWSYCGATFTHLTSATYNAMNGDSGGVVYSYISSSGIRPTLGIHRGRTHGESIYVKANEINRVLGTSRY